jgi:hypothetical protein
MASYPSSGVFDPDAVSALADAYAHACAALAVADRTDPLTESIAKIIIERAKRGELDPVRLCEGVLEELRARADWRVPTLRRVALATQERSSALIILGQP